jgi:hypothetical protein
MSMETGAVSDVRRIIQGRSVIWVHQQFQLASGADVNPVRFRLQAGGTIRCALYT